MKGTQRNPRGHVQCGALRLVHHHVQKERLSETLIPLTVA